MDEKQKVPDLRLFRTSEVARMFAMSAPTFLRLAARHKIKPVKYGPRLTRWRACDLIPLIDLAAPKISNHNHPKTNE